MNIHLKLGVGIVALFGLILAGYYTYEPAWWKWQSWQIASKDPSARDSAIKNVAEKGKKAMPFVRKWLASDNDIYISAAIDVLKEMGSEFWMKVAEEVETILIRPPSETRDKAAKFAVDEIKVFKELEPGRFGGVKWGNFPRSQNAKINVCLYLLDNSDNNADIKSKMVYAIGDIGGKRAVAVLSNLLLHKRDWALNRIIAEFFGRTKDTETIATLSEFIRKAKNMPDDRLHCREDAVWTAIRAMEKIGTDAVIEPMIDILQNGDTWEKRAFAAWVLSRYKVERVIQPLLYALRNDEHVCVRQSALDAFDRFDNVFVIDLMVETLENSESPAMREIAAENLRWSKDARVVGPLIKALESDNHICVRIDAADALGEIGDNRAIESLIAVLEQNDFASLDNSAFNKMFILCEPEHDYYRAYANPVHFGLEHYGNSSDLTGYAAIALAGFSDDERIVSALQNSSDKGNLAATAGLAWIKGGKYLEAFTNIKIDFEEIYLYFHNQVCTERFAIQCRAKWGDLAALDYILTYFQYSLLRHQKEIFSLLPEEFPKYDFDADYSIREKQQKKIRDWCEKNFNSLAWDAEKRKYILKN
jgi:HEAT repeat protein